MRSTTTQILLIAAAATSALAQSSSPKRGLCYVATDDSSTDDHFWDASDSDLTWYYNYGASPTSAFSGSKLQFVPMLWGNPTSDTDMTFYNTVSSLIEGGTNISYVLAFNEPDGCSSGGSCVPAATAAEVWIREIEPLKTKYNVSLGAPAVTGAPTGFTWLQNFFTACAGNCSADFIPVHWYGNFEGLASHVGQVNGTYPNMTMWITEYADAGADLEDSQTFYNQTADWFDNQLPYLTHYSYFGAFRSDVSNVGADAAFLTQKGELTDIGSWYLGGDATGNIPKGGAGQVAKFAGWTAVTVAACFWVMA